MDCHGRVMIGGLLCAVSAFLLAQSSPTSLFKSSNEAFETTSHEKPLVRTKRAEELMNGNRQNAHRVKKSASLATSDKDEATKTDANELPPEEKDRKDDAEQSLPEEKQKDEGEEYGVAANEQNSLEKIPIDDSEHEETTRRRRSAKAEALMTAEGMASASAVGRFSAPVSVGRTLRAKRDLDYEELRELLENSREAEKEEEEEDDDDVVPVAVVVPVSPETNSEGEEEEEEEEEEEGNGREDDALSLDIPSLYDPRYGVSSEKEDLIRELVTRKEEEKAKEKLIDFLLAAAINDAGDDDGRFLVEASSPSNDDDDVGDYIGPVAAAVVKRNALYPYSYEPYGGRWGALVPGPKRSRNGGEYERLTRLAEALGAYDDYEEEE